MKGRQQLCTSNFNRPFILGIAVFTTQKKLNPRLEKQQLHDVLGNVPVCIKYRVTDRIIDVWAFARWCLFQSSPKALSEFLRANRLIFVHMVWIGSFILLNIFSTITRETQNKVNLITRKRFSYIFCISKPNLE